MNENISVILVDMQDLVRSGFSLALRNEPGIDVVAEANSAEPVLALAKKFKPDVIIMDILMPDFRGAIKVMESIREMRPEGRPRIVVLTSFQDDQCLFRALEAGVSGFLLKGTSRVDLVEAVRHVAAGQAVLCPEATRRLIDHFQIRPVGLSARAGAVTGRLSKRELQVLCRVASGRSNQEVADDLYLTSATVKSHVSNVLSKLELRDRVQLALFAYDTGLVRSAQADGHWSSDEDASAVAGQGWE